MASNSLSDKDMNLYIEIISIGTAKLISKTISDNPEKLARHISKENNFGLTFTSVINNIQGKNAADIFRQNDIRNALHESIKGMRSETISAVKGSLYRLGTIEPSNELQVTKRPGKQSSRDFKTERLPGPKKLHKTTDLDNDIKKVLNNEKAINRIYMLLLYSTLIFRLVKHGKLISLYAMKINKFNSEKAFRVCKSVFPVESRQETFDEDFKLVSSVYNSKNFKDVLEKRARESAFSYVKSHAPTDYYNVYYSGAYYFFA
jgi:hypothetical protein